MSRFSPAMRPFGQTIAAVFASLAKDFVDVYHPERHYMRGPGPKWREKHGAHAGALRPGVIAHRAFTRAAA